MSDPKSPPGRRERSAAAAQRELKARFGTTRPRREAPIGFSFEQAGAGPAGFGPRHLLSRCVLVRPYVREVFALAIAAHEGSRRGERSFQVPGKRQENVEAVLDLIPPEISYSRDSWRARHKTAASRRTMLAKELSKLACPYDPEFEVSEHPVGRALGRMAVVLTASEVQGLRIKVLTRPGIWLEEESPLHAWPEAEVRPVEAIAAHEALDLAREMREAGIEIADPDSLLTALEPIVRGHIAVRSVPGLPGLAEVVRGRAEGWPAASRHEVAVEEARREVHRAREGGSGVVLDPEVADVLRMAAARPALDGDILPPQRIAVARQRITDRGLTNASQVGTGKSAMTLIACRGKAAELEAYRVFLGLPRALRSEWVEEQIPKFWEGVAVHAVEAGRRGRLATGLIAFDRGLGGRPGIVVATFEQIRSLVEALRVLTYDDLVVDEGDVLANPNTQLSRALWRLRERARVAIPLTATPLGKSSEELDAIEAFARGDREALRRRPLARRFGSFDDMSMRRLRRALGPALVRVTREEMHEYMPDVEEAIHKVIDPSPAELALLDAAEERIATLFGDLRGQVDRAAALAPGDGELAELQRRMASTRGLLLSATEVALLAAGDAEALRSSKAVAAAVLESGGLIDAVVRTRPTKRTWIAGTLAAAEADGERTLVFAESVELLRLLGRELEEVHGVAAPLYSGGLGEEEGLRLRRSFRRGEVRTMLLSPVGNRGYNLPASLVVHYDLPWEARRFEQRTGRATRTGSDVAAVAVLLALIRTEAELHRAELMVPRAALTDGTLNRGEDGTARPGEGGSRELALQLGGLASELAARQGASTKLRVAEQIFRSRRAAPPA